MLPSLGVCILALASRRGRVGRSSGGRRNFGAFPATDAPTRRRRDRRIRGGQAARPVIFRSSREHWPRPSGPRREEDVLGYGRVQLESLWHRDAAGRKWRAASEEVAGPGSPRFHPRERGGRARRPFRPSTRSYHGKSVKAHIGFGTGNLGGTETTRHRAAPYPGGRGAGQSRWIPRRLRSMLAGSAHRDIRRTEPVRSAWPAPWTPLSRGVREKFPDR